MEKEYEFEELGQYLIEILKTFDLNTEGISKSE